MTPTIGILAGMGPRSTSPFLELVLNECQRQYGAKFDIDYPHILTYSLPTPFYLNRELDHDAMERTIIGGAKRLEAAGASFIAIPCNSAHLYIKAIQSALAIPTLDIIETTIAALPDRKLSTVLATPSTMNSRLYQKRLEEQEIPYAVHEDWQDQVNRTIRAVKDGAMARAHLVWEELVGRLQEMEIRNVILGCTELSALSSKSNELHFIDSGAALARETVSHYCSLRGIGV